MVLKSPDQKQYWSQGIEFEMVTHIMEQKITMSLKVMLQIH